jgi:hypothetical protein
VSASAEVQPYTFNACMRTQGLDGQAHWRPAP